MNREQRVCIVSCPPDTLDNVLNDLFVLCDRRRYQSLFALLVVSEFRTVQIRLFVIESLKSKQNLLNAQNSKMKDNQKK